MSMAVLYAPVLVFSGRQTQAVAALPEQAREDSLNRLRAERDAEARKAESLGVALASLRDDFERVKQVRNPPCWLVPE